MMAVRTMLSFDTGRGAQFEVRWVHPDVSTLNQYRIKPTLLIPTLARATGLRHLVRSR